MLEANITHEFHEIGTAETRYFGEWLDNVDNSSDHEVALFLNAKYDEIKSSRSLDIGELVVRCGMVTGPRRTTLILDGQTLVTDYEANLKRYTRDTAYAKSRMLI